MTKDLITDLIHDKLTISAFAVFAAAEINPGDFLATNTPEARWFTNVLFALAVASFILRLWRRSIEIRIENIELHRREMELKEEEIRHEVVQKNVEEITKKSKEVAETTFLKKI